MLQASQAAKQIYTCRGYFHGGARPAGGGFQLNLGSGMRGIVAFAIMTAILAVIDAAFFKGKYLKDSQEAITGLASISMQMGRR